MSDPAVVVERDGHILTITLNRPDKRNAFNAEVQAFDVRVAGENAQLGITEVQRGLFPMSASTIRLPRQIPYTVAMDMLLVGDPISGRRAYEVGLVGHVTADGMALAKAREVADRVASSGTLTTTRASASFPR